MPPLTLDIYDQSALTAQVQRAITVGKENLPSLGDSIMPMNEVQTRKVKMRIIDVDAFGVGQLRAPDAVPQLYRSTQRIREELIELALPDEMERISEDTLEKLTSTDPLIKLTAGTDVVTKGAVLAARSFRRVEAMRWSAMLNGYVDLDYVDSSQRVTYNVPASNYVQPGVLWSTIATSDPVTDVRGWQKQMSDMIGTYGTRLHMNTNTWEYLFQSAKVRALLSSYGRSLLIPSGTAEVASLFREGTTITIYDGGYRAQLPAGAFPQGNTGWGDSQLTKYLPDGKVLITPPYTLPETGQAIADTLNGRVRVSTGYNAADWVQGPASEMILHHISKNEMLRYARANIPRLLVPEAFMVATVA